MLSSSKAQGLEAALWGVIMGGHRKTNPSPTPEAPSLPETPDEREIPKWEPFRTRSAREDQAPRDRGQASLCVYGGGGHANSPPLPHLLCRV